MPHYDLSLTEEDDGSIMMHTIKCKSVRARADAGEPVFTMFGCDGLPDHNIKRHSCLDRLRDAKSESDQWSFKM